MIFAVMTEQEAVSGFFISLLAYIAGFFLGRRWEQENPRVAAIQDGDKRIEFGRGRSPVGKVIPPQGGSGTAPPRMGNS